MACVASQPRRSDRLNERGRWLGRSQDARDPAKETIQVAGQLMTPQSLQGRFPTLQWRD